jgi:hypothetical protein
LYALGDSADFTLVKFAPFENFLPAAETKMLSNKFISIKVIRDLNRSREENIERFNRLLEEIIPAIPNQDELIQLFLYILFTDAVKDIVPMNYAFGLIGYGGEAIISYLMSNIFKMEYDPVDIHICEDSSPSRLLDLLLILERKHKKIYSVDPKFFKSLILNVTDDEATDILSSREVVTPITMEILRNMEECSLNNIFSDFFCFFKSLEKGYVQGVEYLTNSNFDCKRFKGYVLSRRNGVGGYYTTLTKYYPELLTYHEYIHPNRLKIYSDVLGMELKCKTMRTYSSSYISYLREKLAGENIDVDAMEQILQCLEVLLKVILIDKCLKVPSPRNRGRFYRKVVHPFIVESPSIVRIMIERSFDINLVDEVIKCVPSFHIGIDISLQCLKNHPNSPFYQKLMESLIKQYPLPVNIEKVREMRGFLSSEYLDGLGKRIDLPFEEEYRAKE